MSKQATLGDLRELHDSWAERFVNIEEAMAVLTVMVENSMRSVTDSGPRVFVDEYWLCSKCSTKIAVWDSEGTIRIKHKDLMVYFDPGPGGKARIICRTCGHENELTDERPMPELSETEAVG